jgi:hypothetical protein
MTAVIGLGLLVVAGLVVGVLVLLGVGTTSAVRSVVADDGDRTTVVGGSGWNAARTSLDGRSLVVVLTGSAPYEPGNPCTSELSATAEESGERITVTVSARSPKVDREYACDAVGYLRLVEVPLDRPLAGRTVVDADGGVHEVFDGTVLLDPAVAEGWTVTSEGDGGVWPGARPSWTRTWSAAADPAQDLPPTACVGGPSSLVVTQGAADLFEWVSTHGDRIGSAEVQGQEAVVMTRPFSDDLTVTWADGDTGFAVSAQSRCSDDTAMPLDELLVYARSLT